MAQQTVAQTAGAVQPVARRSNWPLIGALAGLALLGAFGNAWDLYWHIMVGRDTFWIPPHTMMYAAVALSGLASAAVVLTDTFARRPRARPHQEVTSILGFRAPLGHMILGLGALQMVVSAPFDDWWHRVYGVDVTVWSPPHLVGFSGAIVMLAGLIIATTSERLRTGTLAPERERMIFALLALLFAPVVRWITFLNSTSLQLSWKLDADEYAIVGPWAPWWGLWASLFMAWTFVASARCLPGRLSWRLPLAVCALALLLRALEFAVSAVGFESVLPWGTQTLRRPFRPFFDYDLGLWVTTAVLLPPVLALCGLCRVGQHWDRWRFGLSGGAIFGLLLATQFLLLRPVFHLVPLSAGVQMEVLATSFGAGLLGGVIGAVQGDWLAHFRG